MKRHENGNRSERYGRSKDTRGWVEERENYKKDYKKNDRRRMASKGE